ncbi:hypothetical protein NP233_g10263 [Leucocoprinus birnbaumii]|uniref:Carboxylic ester hydrolase n=1 Tax=Leucocoprinus birnbaumii TaxID=56174 RepID=A0AAD5VKN7_9AGAR|nr:hypothetical protein NP233_g10263 [Leucocoprinus birnbaumii]
MFVGNFLSLATTLATRLADHQRPLVFDEVISQVPHGNIVDLGYARYLGNQTVSWPNTVAYLGVPYAEPPLGDLRFRAPVPLNTARVAEESQGKVLDATFYPEACIQGAMGSTDAGGAGSEDCLKVNIYAPAGAQEGAKLPVLVYIHEGAYVWGNPASWPYEHWVEQSPNVIIVSTYYRLDGFGFLSTPEFSTGELGDLNAGFLDQIEALRWVQKYISKFGGDPEKVTINGISAGAASTELHLVANTGEADLFRGVIAQSVYRTPVPMPEQQQKLFDAFTDKAGCGSGDLATKMACMRAASVSTLAIAQDYVSRALTGYRAFHPVVDEKVIPDYPTRLIQKGLFRKVPLIVGATTNEMDTDGLSLPAHARRYFPSLSDENIKRLQEAYPRSEFPSEDAWRQTICTSYSFSCARSTMASEWDKAGVNTWTYRYNQPDPALGEGVLHSAELNKMFRGVHIGLNGTYTFSKQTPSEVAFSQELIAYWLSFARTLDPNTHKLDRAPVWPAYSVDKRDRIVLQEAPVGSDVGAVSGSYLEIESETDAQRCSLMASMVDEMQN